MPIERGVGSYGTGSVVAWLLLNYAEVTKTHSAVTGTEDIDMQDGNIHLLTLTGNVTLTFSNPAPGDRATSLTLVVTQDGTGSRIITWPGSVVWPSGTTPVLTTTASAVDILTFFTPDEGTTWYGFFAGANMS